MDSLPERTKRFLDVLFPPPKPTLTFVNEAGNLVQMRVWQDRQGVHVYAKSPESTVEHTWTPGEAEALLILLGLTLERDDLEAS